MVLLLFVQILLVSLVTAPDSAKAQGESCASFDAWVWAQSYLELHSDAAAALDPDGNGLACDALRGIEGFSPALWTTSIPTSAYAAQLVGVIDGDSILVNVDGVLEEVRLYRADAPEFAGPECGAYEARSALRELLAYNDAGATIHIEHDRSIRDRYHRLLAYVWIEIDGRPYLVNEAIVRSGWAADKDYGDRIYAAQMNAAAVFASDHAVGTYRLCGPIGPNVEDA